MIKQYEYEVNNKVSYGCSICHAFNKAYNSNNSNFHCIIPKEAGEGYLNRVCCSRGIRIIEYNLKLSYHWRK